jgi:hypothetical protein
MIYNYYVKIGIAVIILRVVIISVCTQNQAQKPQNTSPTAVIIQNFTFTPNTLTVKAGTNFTGINQDSTV